MKDSKAWEFIEFDFDGSEFKKRPVELLGAGSEEEFLEGRVKLRLHRQKERNLKLVRRKKETSLAMTGKLVCEVCEFDFADSYGDLGKGFAECHHRTPLADLKVEQPTRLSDLAIACANCHRMLHRRQLLTVEKLREIVQSRRRNG